MGVEIITTHNIVSTEVQSSTFGLSEVVWQEKFEQTQNKLDQLGENVLAEIAQGWFKK